MTKTIAEILGQDSVVVSGSNSQSSKGSSEADFQTTKSSAVDSMIGRLLETLNRQVGSDSRTMKSHVSSC